MELRAGMEQLELTPHFTLRLPEANDAVPKLKLPANGSPPTSMVSSSVLSANAFATPLINGLFADAAAAKASERATGANSATARFLDSSRSGIAVPKNGVRKLEVTVIDHPEFDGVVVSELGSEGACKLHGLKVGDHISKINNIRCRDHRTSMWLADASENRVRFSLADSTETFVIDRATWGDVGLTLVNNTTAKLGVVVVHVVKGSAADKAGLNVGHVIQSVDGELAWHHHEIISKIDASSSTVELVVARRKLTEANVLNQHVGQVPVTIVVVA